MSFTEKQLLPGESLIVLTRQHPLVLFKPVFINAIVLAILIGLCVLSAPLWLLALYVIPLLYLIWKLLAWQRKEYILTDRRVVLQEGVLSVSSFDASLDKINNVYHNQSFLGRMLNYGDVGLETASEAGTTTFEFLSQPVSFKNSIVHQRESYRTDSVSAGRSLTPNIPQMIEELASLRDRNIITESEFQEKKRALLQKI
jgi:uncharacterized membrane protein YdbT with pleckstrin-like domain